jgi:hypothetical protein
VKPPARTVGLDDEPPFGPEEVDETPVDMDVDLGTRQAVAVTEVEEEQLEVRARAVDETEVRDAVPGELRLAERTAEEVRLDDRADVFDRAGGGRDRDAAAVGDVIAGEGAGAMELESRPRVSTNSGR